MLENNTTIIDKDTERKRLFIREALLINKLKPAINTQYSSFSNILRVQNYNQNNPIRKQDIVNENENEMKNNIHNTIVTHNHPQL